MSHVDRDKCSYEVNSKKINDITPVKLEGADLVNYCTRLNDYNYDPDGKKHPKSDFSKLSTENGEKKRYTPPENLCQCKSALGDKFDYDPSRSQGGKKRKTKKTRKSKKSRKSRKSKKSKKSRKKQLKKGGWVGEPDPNNNNKYNYTYYESAKDPYAESQEILKDGHVGDSVTFISNNLTGPVIYEIVEGDTIDGKSLEYKRDVYSSGGKKKTRKSKKSRKLFPKSY